MKVRPARVWSYLLAGWVTVGAQGTSSFINFETAPVHPVALSPDSSTLAVCNLPDGRVEFFNIAPGLPIPVGSVPVGVDPVSVRFRTTNELWVINHISSSVSVVDLAKRRVVATLNTMAGPADVVFAGSLLRAFVSCAKADTVQVFDTMTRQSVTNLAIDGDRPKALAVSPDGARVYVAIFESGNRSTILAPALSSLDNVPGPGPVEHPDGPYGGQNPPPNSGTGFFPPINPMIPSNVPPPRVSHIVKKNADGRWMDDNNGDWTEIVSGTNAALSGRVTGWDLPDHDVAIIDTASFEVSYATGLMNLCMSLAVNPVSGRIAVVGTDGMNERRFEPNLRGKFLRVNLALVNPLTQEKTIVDLNPHLDYSSGNIPPPERDKSIGNPRGMVWNSSGTRGYVTGMGSRNLVVVDADGHRLGAFPVELGEGPTGLALDEARERLYVLNRFSATLSVLDTVTMIVVTNVPFFDPTPAVINAGRRHFQDTRRNSGLGQASCASCHPDGRMDRLAWDLGDPAGDELLRTNVINAQDRDFTFHPMKGPMVTQTFQDIIGHEPFHWRGDRFGIEDFNRTFTNLLGADASLTATEMQEFKDFLSTIHFPPNRFRNFDDTLSTNVPMPGEPSLIGDAVRGLDLFLKMGGDVNCGQCHVPPTGLSGELGLGGVDYVPPGPNGERHLALIILGRSDFLPLKGPQLRNLADKVGMNLSRTNSRAGFGFTHDGRAGSLFRFLESIFGLDEVKQDAVDLGAFLFSFSAPLPGETPVGSFPPIPSRDVAASVGKQLTLTNAAEVPPLRQMLAVAESVSNRADLVVRGVRDGLSRGWVYDRIMHEFQSDRHGEVLLLPELLALASPTNELTFTVVPRGSGRRIGLDRDDDGFFDRTELELGFDPLDPASHGANTPPRLDQPQDMAVYNDQLFSIIAHAVDDDSFPAALTFRLGSNTPAGTAINPTNGLFTWTPTLAQAGTTYRIGIQVTDDGRPPLSDEKEFVIVVDEVVPIPILGFELVGGVPTINVRATPRKSYRLQFKDRLDDPEWTDSGTSIATSPVLQFFDFTFFHVPQRFYRVALLD